MKLELKNLKRAAFASHETHCYAATVYFNNKRAWLAANDGHGGADYYDPLNGQSRDEFEQVYAAAQAWITSQCIACGGRGKTDEKNKNNSHNQWIRFAKQMVELGDCAFASAHSHTLEDCQREYDEVQESLETFKRSGIRIPHERPSAEDEFYDCIDCMMEVHIAKLINTTLLSKDLKKLLKTKVLFTEGNGIFQTAYKGKRAVDQNLIDHVTKENPSAVVLNALDFEEALGFYAEDGA